VIIGNGVIFNDCHATKVGGGIIIGLDLGTFTFQGNC
jgi:hypothetical protein